MKTRGYVCIISISILIISTSFIIATNYFATRMQEKESLFQELNTAKDESTKLNSELKQLNEKILLEQEELNEYENQLSSLQAKQNDLIEKIEQESVLYDVKIGGLPLNYDVENFREAEKTSSQISKGMGLIFGNYIGTLLDSDDTSNVSSAEKLRLNLYERISDIIDESYCELASAKVVFDGSFSFYKKLSELNEAELLPNAAIIGKCDSDKLLEEEKVLFLNALAKYSFDLSNAYMVYAATLTDNENAYLEEIQYQLSCFSNILSRYDFSDTKYGYSDDEKVERYKRVLSFYTKNVEELCLRNADKGTKNQGEYIQYGVRTIQGYTNKGKAILLYENTTFGQLRMKCFYDADGNVIEIVFGEKVFLVRDGKVVYYDANNITYSEAELQTFVDSASELKELYDKNYLGVS